MASRSRRPRRSSRCGAPGSSWVATLELLREAMRVRLHDRRSRRAWPRRTSATLGGVPSFLGSGYPPFPASSASRSTTRSCTGSPAPRARRGRRRLPRLRRDRRRLARRRGDHGGPRRGPRGVRALMRDHRGRDLGRARGDAPRREGRRHLPAVETSAAGRAPTASSRTTPATASAPRCTCRPMCPTSAAPAAAYGSSGVALAVEPMVTLGTDETDCSTTTGPW